MDRNEAKAALDVARDTDRRMGARMHWPFYRHAMFGLMEALIVVGIGTPGTTGMAAIGGGVAMTGLMVALDRRRDGMFVSGWQSKAARPMMWGLIGFVLAMIIASLLLKPASGVAPAVVALGVLTFAICTLASLRWEKLYRRELGLDGRRGA